jgi:drug/metabolite transporter (DMT)-like permease
MTAFALGIVLLSAVAHATWNLYSKRAKGGAAFVWTIDALAALIYAPLAIIAIARWDGSLGAEALLFIVGSAILHLAYFLMLQQGYRIGDLSLVYPLARGTGPMLSTLTAIIIFGERPGPIALGGAVLIGIGTFVLSGGGARTASADSRRAVAFALLTGAIIASYTLWDKHAVSGLGLPPLFFNWALGLGRLITLTPFVLRRRSEVITVWQEYRREAWVVAILSPLSYILVLTALAFTPVSYVAPAREIGILIGVLFVARLLAEGHARRRILAGSAMVVGVIALALG